MDFAEGEGTFSVRRTCALEAAGSAGDRAGFLSVVLMITSVMFSRAVVSIFRAEPGF